MFTETPASSSSSSSPQDQGFFAKQAVKGYADQHFPKLKLSESVIEQLSWSLRGPKQEDFVSPEARATDDRRFFDIKRMFLRAESIRLLKSEDANSYDEFLKLHPTVSVASFQKISAVFKLLDKNLQEAVFNCCFLTHSVYVKIVLRSKGITPLEDSEQFFSQILADDGILKLLPLTQSLSPEVIQIMKLMYPKNTHFRHMLFVEGAGNMTKHFQALNPSDFQKAFTPWYWRWIADLLGFGIKDAKADVFVDNFLNPDTLANIEATFEMVKADPSHFLNARLSAYVSQAKLDVSNLKPEEVLLLGRMIAMVIGKFGPVSPEISAITRAAYLALQAQDKEVLVQSHLAFCNHPNSLAPTYLPGLMHSFYNKVGQNIEDTMSFMFQIMKGLFAAKPESAKSCQKLASNIEGCLDKAVQQWNATKHIDFSLDDGGELRLIEARTLSSAPAQQ